MAYLEYNSEVAGSHKDRVSDCWLLETDDIQSQPQVQCSSSYYTAPYCKWWSLLRSHGVRINIYVLGVASCFISFCCFVLFVVLTTILILYYRPLNLVPPPYSYNTHPHTLTATLTHTPLPHRSELWPLDHAGLPAGQRLQKGWRGCAWSLPWSSYETSQERDWNHSWNLGGAELIDIWLWQWCVLLCLSVAECCNVSLWHDNCLTNLVFTNGGCTPAGSVTDRANSFIRMMPLVLLSPWRLQQFILATSLIPRLLVGGQLITPPSKP